MPSTRIHAATSALLLIAVLGLAGCSQEQTEASAPAAAADSTVADLLITNARIYTQNPAQPWAESLAIRDGRIIAIGTTEQTDAVRGPDTEVRDLDGAFAMPGLNDGHSHPAWGGVLKEFQCVFKATDTPADVQIRISDCVANARPGETLIQGGLWGAEFFTQYAIASPRQWLDAISGDLAIVLTDDSGHNRWLNSTALEMFGITAEMELPTGVILQREADGKTLNGVVLEGFALLKDRIPAWSEAQYVVGARFAMRNANQYGITAFKDASGSSPETAAYKALDQSGELTVRVASCLLIDDPLGPSADEVVKELSNMRDTYRSPRVYTNFTKIFLDGIPTTSRTAAMLDPYVPEHEGDAPDYGSLHVPEDRLSALVTALDAAGFVIKMHAAGDRSVHVGLNAIEAARKANGNSQRRHELAHAGFVAPTDIPRFNSLNAVADLSPYLWYPSPIIASIDEALGKRGHDYWPIRSLLDAGAPVLAGSDWPSVALDLNPWIGMEAMVTRQDPAQVYEGEGWQAEAITVAEAVKIFTIDGARAIGIDDISGTLEVGKSADLAVLNHNLLEIPPHDISETRVLMTVLEGDIVYEASETP